MGPGSDRRELRGARRSARLKGTKTDEERWLSVDALAIEQLQALRAARLVALAPTGPALPTDAFVFSPDPLGQRPWHPDHFPHAYRRLADALGVPEPLKNFRHFNATQLLAAGVDLPTTAARLGHSDGGATTSRVYASWTRPADQRVAGLLASDLTTLRKTASAASQAAAAPIRRRGLLALVTRRPRCWPNPGEARAYVELAGRLRAATARCRQPVAHGPRPGAVAVNVHRFTTCRSAFRS